MHREPLVSSVVTVLGFWLFAVTGYSVYLNRVDLASLLDLQLYIDTLRWPLAGVAAGASVAVLSIYLYRRFTLDGVAGHAGAGVITGLGRVPIIVEELEAAEHRVSDEILRSVSSLANVIMKRDRPPTDMLEVWRKHYAKSYPAHAALLDKLERVLMRYRHLPATHVQDGPRNHGGRSLIEHSLLIAFLMEWNAPQFSYPVNPAKPHLPLLDPQYTFNSSDPLILLAGIAHDIGKIECYEFAPDDPKKVGAPVGSRHDHDKVGARCLARMPEFWALPDEDRDVLLLCCAYYHTPQSMPMSSPKTVRSDRLHAITELLIKWDGEGSALENREGARLTDETATGPEEVPATKLFEAKSEAGRQLLLWNLVRELVLEPGRVNGQDRRRNLGWKYHFPHLGKTLLFLVEDQFVQLVAARGELEDEMEGNFSGAGVDPLTRKILSACFEQGALYLDFEDARTRSPEMLTYVARMYKPTQYFENVKTKTAIKPVHQRGKEVLKLGSVLVLELSKEVFPELLALQDNNLVPEIRHFRTGSAGRRGRKPNASAGPDTGGWVIPDVSDRVAESAPGASDTAGSLPPAPFDSPTPVEQSDAPSGATSAAQPTTSQPVVAAKVVTSVSTKPIASAVLVEHAKRGLASGTIQGRVNEASGVLMVRGDSEHLVEVLHLDTFGYADAEAFLADVETGRIHGTDILNVDGVKILRITLPAGVGRAVEEAW
ncbi:hypothetical protein ACN8ZM_39725 (plasmid) [Burkholderia aenigmatica]|uniref:hypothetical protein n=1 Tax=Burkholderia aenigmatica TaxID=2015348 RepID=UPI003B43647F